MNDPVAPLTDLRVLELAGGVAGPYAGRLLAMLGATVVKVEPPGGDPARTKPVDDEPVIGTSPLYLHLNAGKLNISPTAIGSTDWDAVIDDRVRAAGDRYARSTPRRRRTTARVDHALRLRGRRRRRRSSTTCWPRRAAA